MHYKSILILVNVRKLIPISIISLILISMLLLGGSIAQSNTSNNFNFITYTQGNNNITDFKVYYGGSYIQVFSYVGYETFSPEFSNHSYINFVNKMYGGLMIVGLRNVSLATPLNVGDQHNISFDGASLYYRLLTNGQYTGILLSKDYIYSSDGFINISSLTPFFIYYQTLPIFGNLNFENYSPTTNGITFNISDNFLENVGVQSFNFSLQPLNRISFNGELEEEGYIMKSDDQIISIDNGASPNIEIYNLLGEVSISLNPGFSLVPSQLEFGNNNSFDVPIFGNLILSNPSSRFFDIMFGNLTVGAITAPSNSSIQGNNITINSPFSPINIYLYNLEVASSGIPVQQIISSNEINSIVFIGNNVSILPINNSYILNYTQHKGTLNIHLFQGNPGYIIMGVSKFMKIDSVFINNTITNYTVLYTTQNATFYKISDPYEGEENLSIVYTNQLEQRVRDLFNGFLLVGIILILASAITIMVAYFKHIKAAKRIIMK